MTGDDKRAADKPAPHPSFWLRWLDRPWLPPLIVGLFFTLFAVYDLQAHHTVSASLFVCAGDGLCDRSKAPSNLIVSHGMGYDGQYCYRLALSPFTQEQTAFGIKLDAPPYRQQRIFYPLLAYILDFGNPIRAARSLLLLNLAAITILTYLGALYARDHARHSLWGVLVGINAGALFTLTRDTTELVAISIALIGLRLAGRRRFGVAAIAFTCSMLTRETTLVAPAAVLVTEIAPILLRWLRARTASGRGNSVAPVSEPRAGSIGACAPLLAPFAVYACWQVYLTHVWGISASAYSHGRFTFPFGAIWELLCSDGGAAGVVFLPIIFCELFLILLTLLLAAGNLRSSAAAPAEKLCWMVFALMGVSYSYEIYNSDFGFMRILIDFFAFSTLLVIASRTRDRWYLLIANLALTVILSKDFLTHR